MSFGNLSKTWWASCALLVTSAVAGGGCVVESASEPTGPQYTYPTEASFCTALAKAECNKTVVGACFGSDDTTLEADTAKCVTAREATCNPQNLPYNPAAADACIAKRTSVLSDAELTRVEIDDADEACLAVFSRDGGSGVTCAVNTDCNTADGLRCVVKPGQASGTCATPEILGGGEKCTADNAVCDVGFFCSATAGDYCVAQPALGEACAPAMPCQDAFKCSADVDGVCEAKLDNGAVCADDLQCSGGFCLKSTGQTDGNCSAKYKLEFTSQSCDPFR